MILYLQRLDLSLKKMIAGMGAKWAVLLALAPIIVWGCAIAGMRSLLVLVTSVSATLICATIAKETGTRMRSASASAVRTAPGTLITGVLLALTLRADTPLYMVICGAVVAEIIGKVRFAALGHNLLNPAALGRGAVAVLEYIDPPAALVAVGSAMVSGASPLFKATGGYGQLSYLQLLLGTGAHGAIGELPKAALVLGAVFLFRYVVVKRSCALAMLLAAPATTALLLPSSEVLGHAPWVADPFYSIVGGPLLLIAPFFLTDPATTPQTPFHGWLLGGLGGISCAVLRMYSDVPAPEMFVVLAVNCIVGLICVFTRADPMYGRSNHSSERPSAAVAQHHEDLHDDLLSGGASPSAAHVATSITTCLSRACAQNIVCRTGLRRLLQLVRRIEQADPCTLRVRLQEISRLLRIIEQAAGCSCADPAVHMCRHWLAQKESETEVAT